MMNTENKEKDILLKVNSLRVHYETRELVYEAVNGVSFEVERGKTLGLVGETGAGKTTIALAIMGLLPTPPAHILEGEIFFEGENLLEKKPRELQNVRGSKISMIFQDPMTALNPILRIGDQIEEVLHIHQKISKAEAKRRAVEILKMVGIREERFNDYPHQFSGGMKQRVIIAIALACRPQLIIADEPTTALDVTIQAQVLELMKRLQKDIGTSMIMITHDMGVVAETCDSCAVIYAGDIVEYGTVAHIFRNRQHPYTTGLFDSIPRLDVDMERLTPIAGLASDPTELPEYCSFYDRCKQRCDECKKCEPPVVEIEPGHYVKCLLAKEMPRQ